MKALVLPVLVLVAVLLSPAGCELYYVRGSSSSPDATPCPPEASPCLTLQEYVDNSTEFLPKNMSDVEFSFLSGEHSLSKPFVVEGGRNISLKSANVRSVWDGLDVTVICSNDAYFGFINTSLLSIHGIAFHKCGYGNYETGDMVAALVLYSTDFLMQDVEFVESMNRDVDVCIDDTYGSYKVSDCVIHGGPETAIVRPSHIAVNVGNTGAAFDIDFRNIFINSTASGCVEIEQNYDDGDDCWFGDYTGRIVGINILNEPIYHNGSSVALHNVTIVGIAYDGGIYLIKFRAPVVVDKCNFSVETNGGLFIVAHGPTAILDSSFYNSGIGLSITANLTDDNTEHYIMVSNCSFSVLGETDSVFSSTIEISLQAGTNVAVILRHLVVENIGSKQSIIVVLRSLPNVTLEGVHFTNNRGTPILLINSIVHVFGENFFTGNHAIDGGGMAFIDNSAIVLHNNSLMVFRDNYATNVGGAWYVQGEESLDSPFFLLGLYNDRCFIAIQPLPTSSEVLNTLNISVQFINNTAGSGGNVLYGGSIDSCRLDGGNTSDSIDLCMCFQPCPFFQYGSQLLSDETIFSYEPEGDRSRLASAATRVCLCDDNGVPNCTKLSSTIQGVYPGQLFNVSVVTVGQRFGVVNGTVYGHLLPLNGYHHSQIGMLFGSQRVGIAECTSLNYSVVSDNVNSMETLVLTAKGFITGRAASCDVEFYKNCSVINKDFLTTPVYVNVSLLQCPPGFILSEELLQCVCDSAIVANHLTCDIDIGKGTVVRSGEVWVSYWTSNQSTGQDGVVVSMHCPNGYCNEETQHINLDNPDAQCNYDHSDFLCGGCLTGLENPDAQCNFNRCGVLCGGCPTGLSLALGSNQCLKCSNSFIALLIPFAVSGVLLVLFIQLLDLTVAVGTISGLLFYANILKSYESLFFVPGQTNILTVFISWLNLDFGIETCFFDGLDGYVKTWLQFAFPLYLWLLAGLIVLFSRFTTRTAGNSVPVLATMFLLSYNKLLRTIINIVLFTPLKLPDNSTLNTWSFDANVPFAGSKHIVLVVTGLLVFALAWLPYTLVLLFYQCLLRVNHKRGCRWVFKLKPFFDANFGPLKDKHLYWVGVLLLARAVLLLIFVASSDTSEGILICITIVSSTLILFSGHAYKNWLLSLLENSFFVNLIILCVSTTNYAKLTKSNRAHVIYTSTSIALLEFVGIVCYHCYKRALTLRDKIKRRRHQGYAEIRGDAQPAKPAALAPVVTHSEVDIRNPEARLALRESLLEDLTS